MSDDLEKIWEKVDARMGAQRMETEAEHIARDMREGRFPKRSDPIQVPVTGPSEPMSEPATITQLRADLAAANERAEKAEAKAEAIGGLGAMPEGYCFCSSNRIGDDSKTHEPECAALRVLLTGEPE